MELNNPQFPWLEVTTRPAFCVKDRVIIAMNTAAEKRMLHPGTDIYELVTEHKEAYDTFQNGKLYLSVMIDGLPYNASVVRTPDYDIFTINQDTDDAQLQALSLAAHQLRSPLSNVMAVADQLFSTLDDTDEIAQRKVTQINKGLFQLLRIIGNMSDAGYYQDTNHYGMQSADLASIFDEIMEKIQGTFSGHATTVTYTGLPYSVFGVANPEKLERAVYNLLSNAVKFSPEGSNIDVRLVKNGDQISFIVTNTGTETAGEHGYWDCYRRERSLEDPNHGVGLGMTLVSSVAAVHKGTVLIDHPTPSETRVTMTIAIIKNEPGNVRSNIMSIGDYAGGRDKALLELSEILPPSSYEKIN